MTIRTKDRTAEQRDTRRGHAAENRDDHPERPGTEKAPARQGQGHDERGRYGKSDQDFRSPEPYKR